MGSTAATIKHKRNTIFPAKNTASKAPQIEKQYKLTKKRLTQKQLSLLPSNREEIILSSCTFTNPTDLSKLLEVKTLKLINCKISSLLQFKQNAVLNANLFCH